MIRRPSHLSLNKMPLHLCYSFELRLIIENRDSFRSGASRIAAARRELESRAATGDEKAAAELVKVVE